MKTPRPTAMASALMPLAAAGWLNLSHAAESGNPVAFKAAPVVEALTNQADPADRPAMQQAIRSLQDGEYAKALSAKSKISDFLIKFAAGEALWKEWLFQDRKTAMRSIRSLPPHEFEEQDAHRALSAFIAEATFPGRVQWAKERLKSEDPFTRYAIYRGLARAWPLHDDAATDELLKELPEGTSEGLSDCLQSCLAAIREGRMRPADAVSPAAKMTKLFDKPAEAEMASKPNFEPYVRDVNLGELTGLAAGAATALEPESLPRAFPLSFIQGVGASCSRLTPAAAWKTAPKDPAQASAFWSGYIGALPVVDIGLKARAAQFEALDLPPALLAISARSALISSRTRIDPTAEKLREIADLPTGPFRDEALRYAGSVLEQRGKREEAEELLKKIR